MLFTRVAERPVLAMPLLRVATFIVTLTVVTIVSAWAGDKEDVCPVGCTYASIDSAVAHFLGQGDTLLVKAGTYHEEVDFSSGQSGASGDPAVIMTEGTVIIDGTESFKNASLWTQLDATDVYYTADSLFDVPPDLKVFVDDVPYAFQSDITSNYDDVESGEYAYEASTDRIYVNVGGGNPGLEDIFLTDPDIDQGIDVNSCSYLEISGFIVQGPVQISV